MNFHETLHTDFEAALYTLMDHADAFIRHKLAAEPEFIFFGYEGIITDHLRLVMDAMPSIAVYEKIDMAEWAVVQAVRRTNGDISIDCIYQGDKYGKPVTVLLETLCAQDTITLAHVLNEL